MQSWLILIAAIILEVAGTTAMKLSDGFTRPLPSVLLVVFYLFSLAALTLALKRIDVSVAYAIWAGVGTVPRLCDGGCIDDNRRHNTTGTGS